MPQLALYFAEAVLQLALFIAGRQQAVEPRLTRLLGLPEGFTPWPAGELADCFAAHVLLHQYAMQPGPATLAHAL